MILFTRIRTVLCKAAYCNGRFLHTTCRWCASDCMCDLAQHIQRLHTTTSHEIAPLPCARHVTAKLEIEKGLAYPIMGWQARTALPRPNQFQIVETQTCTVHHMETEPCVERVRLYGPPLSIEKNSAACWYDKVLFQLDHDWAGW